mgnify:CR=1 FL=1
MKKEKLPIKGKIKEAKEFSKDIILMQVYAILMKDKEGQVIYTFSTKKKANIFYKILKKGSDLR